MYDEESGLYYLRSRYYGPEWTRFLSNDSIIQENLFTYCRNNPIAMNDEDGNIPGLSWPGEIHQEIQNRIMKDNEGIIAMEVSIICANGKRGRIDLLNTHTGEYWELKTTVPSLGSILFQLASYFIPQKFFEDEYYKLVNEYGELKLGGAIKGGSFDYTSRLGQDFKVWYQQTAPGVIRYVYTKVEKKPFHLKLPSAENSPGLSSLGIGMALGLIGGSMFGLAVNDQRLN